VLDEPTNHLDLWARGALERSLRRFEGTVLFVSHDRCFVDRVADHLLVIEPGRVRLVEGNYATYQRLVGQGLARPQAESGEARRTATAEKRSAKPVDRPKTARKKRRFPYRKVDDLEREIFERETRIEQLHAALLKPETLRDGNRVRQLRAEISQQQDTLQTLYAHWDEATELNW
jgi:ATP-binding cassette subfamily F protein 3